MRALLLSVSLSLLLLFPTGCGVYSFTGAAIEGKTINIHVLENRARNITPTLAPALTDKIRSRILSQTGLRSQNNESDYDLSGVITTYEVTTSGVQNGAQASQNRLTISVEVTFKNRLNEKANFVQTFTRFADFLASSPLSQVEGQLIDAIGSELADDIFNKAFVNW